MNDWKLDDTEVINIFGKNLGNCFGPLILVSSVLLKSKQIVTPFVWRTGFKCFSHLCGFVLF